MALRVDFNTPIDGGGGRIDMMRVLASSGQDANDLGASVVFSSNFPSAQVESFGAYVGNMTGAQATASGSWYPSRQYGAPPQVFASYTQDNGEILFPYFLNVVYTTAASGGSGGTVSTLERQECIQIDVVDVGNWMYRVDWVVYNFGLGSAITNGTIRARVIGRGAG